MLAVGKPSSRPRLSPWATLPETNHAPLAEMKVKADHRPAHCKPLEQYAGNKLLGGEARQRCIEGEHDGAVEPGRGEKAELGTLVGKAEQ